MPLGPPPYTPGLEDQSFTPDAFIDPQLREARRVPDSVIDPALLAQNPLPRIAIGVQHIEHRVVSNLDIDLQRRDYPYIPPDSAIDPALLIQSPSARAAVGTQNIEQPIVPDTNVDPQLHDLPPLIPQLPDPWDIANPDANPAPPIESPHTSTGGQSAVQREAEVPEHNASPHSALLNELCAFVPIDNENWKVRNPERAVILSRAPPPRLTDAQKASRALGYEERKVREKKLNNAIKRFTDTQQEQIVDMAREHSVAQDKIKDLIGMQTHYKKSRKPNLHNAILHFKAQEVNEGKIITILSGQSFTK